MTLNPKGPHVIGVKKFELYAHVFVHIVSLTHPVLHAPGHGQKPKTRNAVCIREIDARRGNVSRYVITFDHALRR